MGFGSGIKLILEERTAITFDFCDLASIEEVLVEFLCGDDKELH